MAVFPREAQFTAAMVDTQMTRTLKRKHSVGSGLQWPKNTTYMLAFNTYVWVLLLPQLQGEKERRERARIKGINSYFSTLKKKSPHRELGSGTRKFHLQAFPRRVGQGGP